MKDWSSAIQEDGDAEDNHWDTDIKGETENGEHLGMLCVVSLFKYLTDVLEMTELTNFQKSWKVGFIEVRFFNLTQCHSCWTVN